MLRFSSFLLLVAWAGSAATQSFPAAAEPGQAMVEQALANELHAAQDPTHLMRYELRKASARLTSTKEIYETKDGGVALLKKFNDTPLNATDAHKEQDRLTALLNDPARQLHRKQQEDADAARALNVLRALPRAFVYQYAGSGDSPTGKVEKFTFTPNPKFSPQQLETLALTAMAGEIWIDPQRERVMHLEAHLQQDVDFGWGLLGRLNRGGWIRIDQAEVDTGVVRLVHFQMVMSGRVVFKTRNFDTTEDESDFAPLPAGLSYRNAIAMMRHEAR